jgi:hypothetical protein
VAEDRLNEGSEQRNLIAKSIHIMLALDFYKDFEALFLKETRFFYQKQSAENFELLNVSATNFI